MPSIEDLIATELPTVVAFGAIIVFTLVEVGFPRMQARPNWREHLPPVLSFAAFTVITTLILQFGFEQQLLSLFAPLRLINLGRLPLPDWAIFFLGFLVVDFFSYIFHRLSHAVPALWRLHAIHHSDEHVTAVTGQLHHPLETLASDIFLLFIFVLVGMPVITAIIYGLAFAIENAFAHADIALPRGVDRWLRWVIVTPDLHRTHHSSDMREGNSNFSQLLTIWDRLFGTYIERPALPEAELKMGLPAEARPQSFTAVNLLAYPFVKRKRAGRYDRPSQSS
jgi:sterol desaturase/sphingolipid hydroxylase (fatty acid hydroxylase superfamily)